PLMDEYRRPASEDRHRELRAEAQVDVVPAREPRHDDLIPHELEARGGNMRLGIRELAEQLFRLRRIEKDDVLRRAIELEQRAEQILAVDTDAVVLIE